MIKATSGNSGNAPIEGEFQRLHQQAESIDAERDRYDSPGSQQPPEPEPRVDDGDVSDDDARFAAVWLCRAMASGANKLWPVLSYTDDVIQEGGVVLAPLFKRYGAVFMPTSVWIERWKHELAACWFFGCLFGASIDRVRATKKSDHTNKVQHGPQATTSEDGEDGEALNTETIWQQEAPKTDARPDVG